MEGQIETENHRLWLQRANDSKGEVGGSDQVWTVVCIEVPKLECLLPGEAVGRRGGAE